MSTSVFHTHSIFSIRKACLRMALDLSKVGDRERLKPRSEPYWQRLRAGCFLGFRPSKRGGKGSWIARVYDEDTCRYRVKSLGDFGTLPGKSIFAVAKDAAEAVARIVEAGGEVRSEVQTVADACKAYPFSTNSYFPAEKSSACRSNRSRSASTRRSSALRPQRGPATSTSQKQRMAPA